jgi:hypothetical protein
MNPRVLVTLACAAAALTTACATGPDNAGGLTAGKFVTLRDAVTGLS